MIDFDLANKTGLPHIRSWLPGGLLSGDTYKPLNPTRSDRNPGSFVINLSNGMWIENATKESGGDAVSLYAYINHMTQSEAAKKILSDYAGITIETPAAKEKKSDDIIVPVPEFHSIPDFGGAAMVFEYRNAKSELMFYVARYHRQGGKSCIPFSYTAGGWIKKGLDRNLPLYNLPEIVNLQGLPILLVEGEKCVDAARIYTNKIIPCTWSGGTGQLKKTDFTPLKGRKVYYWRDNDEPGEKTLKFFQTELSNLIIVNPKPEWPEKWDIADEIQANRMDILEFIFSHTECQAKETLGKFLDEMRLPFRCLGYQDNMMFFLPNGTGQLFAIKDGSLTKNQLMSMADLDVWRDLFGTETKRGFYIAWDDAINYIYRQVQAAGPFDIADIRGRGAWAEGNSVVLHTGKYIIRDGQEVPLKEYESDHIYERLKEKRINLSAPATDFEGHAILKCIERLSFQTRIEAAFLAGWCALAPFCGVLDWRPHIWITGSSGTGKTTVLKYIISPMLGDFCINTSGLSSGAGIRQVIRNDSIPVVVDEAEPQGYQTGRIQEILDLVRQASSNYKGSKIFKGTQTGTGVSYNMRSMFCLSSINPAIAKTADETRFSMINMMTPQGNWPDLEKEIFSIFSDANCERIRSRTLTALPVIRRNSKIFAAAAGSILNSQRIGDQIGALIAGAMSLKTMEEFTFEKACGIIREYNISGTDTETLSDEMRCFLKIFQSKINYVGTSGKVEATTLMNLISTAIEMPVGPNNSAIEKATEELLKYGIKTDARAIYIASNYTWISELLRQTEWENNYSRILRRLKFVSDSTKTVRFGNYHRGHAVVMDRSNIEFFTADRIFQEAGF
jgi:putative DNA primase/helicase